MVKRRLYKLACSRVKKHGNKQTTLPQRHMEQKAIPAFYCCYLLRSTVSSKSLYVGSTPNPQRRLSQHNGEYKGGARKTSRNSLRPWEMACIVTGFPSSIAALQFEWAWQNPHLSLKIPSDQRITTGTRRTRSGYRRLVRPRFSLTGKLEHLHLLLRVDAFSRWPLSVRFFVSDAFKAWKLWCERESATLRETIKIVFDQRKGEDEDEIKKTAKRKEKVPEDELLPSSQDLATKKRRRKKWDADGEGGVQGLDITYDHLDRHLQKSRDILRPGVDLECNVCHEPLSKDHSFTLVCSHAFCEHIAHTRCLAGEFLRQESSSDESQIAILPTHGKCPGCKNETAWVDLVKELSVRTRSKPKKTAGKRKTTKKGAEEESEDEDSEDEDEGDITAADLAEIPEGREEQVVWGDDTDIDSTLSDSGSERGGKPKKRKGKSQVQKTLPVVIEDSDEDSDLSILASETGTVRGRGKLRKKKGKTPARKALSAVIEDSEIDSDLSNSRSETGKVKSGSKAKKRKEKSQAKEKVSEVVIEDSDMGSDLGNSGSEIGSVTDGRKSKKGRVGTKAVRRKKALPVVIEDSDTNPNLGKS